MPLLRKKFRWKIAALLPVLMLRCFASDSQDTTALSLDEAIAASMAHNAGIRLARSDEEIASSQLRETNAIFLPQLGVSYTALATNNPLNAFGFKLQQQSIAASDFSPGLLNHPAGTPDFQTSVDLKQPLVNLDLLYQRKSARQQIVAYRYKTQRTREYIAFQTGQTYLALRLAYEAEQVWEEALVSARAVYRFTGDRYEQHLIQKSDLLNAQLQVAGVESNLADAKSNIRNASDQLGWLMGAGQGAIYRATDSASFAASPETDSLSAERPDFRALESAIGACDLMIRATRMHALPKLNAFASYQLNDKSAFGFGSNAYLAGVQLSWSIFNGGSVKTRVNTQILERDKLRQELAKQTEEGRIELARARRQKNDAETRIAQQRIAIGQASESFRILQDRYEQGLAGTTDVLMAQTQLSQQKLGYAQAVFQRNQASAYIRFLTAVTGDTNH